QTIDLEPGDSFTFAGYQLTYRSPVQTTQPGREIVGATIEITGEEGTVAVLRPRWNYSGDDPTGIPSPAVMSRPGGDLYLMLLNLHPAGIRSQADTSPPVWLRGVGGLIPAAGGFWSMQPRRPRRDNLEAAGYRHKTRKNTPTG